MENEMSDEEFRAFIRDISIQKETKLVCIKSARTMINFKIKVALKEQTRERLLDLAKLRGEAKGYPIKERDAILGILNELQQKWLK